MPRVTVTITDDQKEFLDEKADPPDRSKAQVVRETIDFARENEAMFTDSHHSDADRTGVMQSDADLEDRLSTLEQRLAELEQGPTGRPEFQDPRGDPRRERQSDGAGRDDLRERMEAELEDLDVPGRRAAVEATRRRAIEYAWERLREEGTMDAGDLQKDVMGKFFTDPTLGYSVSPRNPGYQLWDNCVRDRLVELPGVVAPGARGSTYRFSQ